MTQAAALMPLPARPLPAPAFGLLQRCAAPGCGSGDHDEEEKARKQPTRSGSLQRAARGGAVPGEAPAGRRPRTDPQQDRRP